MNNVKNLKIGKKAVAMALAGTLATCTLTGCNHSLVDIKYEFNKAIIMRDNTATIVSVKSWIDYEGEQIQITTEDGMVIVTSSFDTKLINDRNSDVNVEDFARSVMGEDVVINYFGEKNNKTR